MSQYPLDPSYSLVLGEEKTPEKTYIFCKDLEKHIKTLCTNHEVRSRGSVGLYIHNTRIALGKNLRELGDPTFVGEAYIYDRITGDIIIKPQSVFTWDEVFAIIKNRSNYLLDTTLGKPHFPNPTSPWHGNGKYLDPITKERVLDPAIYTMVQEKKGKKPRYRIYLDATIAQVEIIHQ